MSRRRWTCPLCGVSAMAPGRPRVDDVRRYCLTCSADTGRLVKRECPSLERERAAAAERVKAKAKAKRARATAKRKAAAARAKARRIHGGVDVFRCADRCWAVLQKCGAVSKHKDRPSMRVTLSTTGSGGRAYGRDKISIKFDPNEDWAGVESLILHELCHCTEWGYLDASLPSKPGGRCTPHGDRFNKALAAAAWALWRIEVPIRARGGGYGPSRYLEDELAKIQAARTHLRAVCV